MNRISRRHLLIGGMTLAAYAAAQRPALANPPPVSSFDQRIAGLEQAHNALIGLFAVNLDSGQTLAHRAQDPFAMCSTFKAYAAGRVLQMVGRGQLALDRRVVVDPAAFVANSPVTGPRAGGDMTLAELCQAAPAAERQHRGDPAAAHTWRAAGDHRIRAQHR